ncbi:MAG: guanylate kinase [Sulfurimonas sp.]
MQGAILVLSGPSGAGKSSLLNEIISDIGECYFSISTTTREPREGEIDGVHYYFVSKDEFVKDIKNGLFLEYAKVHDNYYGTSIKPVKEALEDKKLVIFDIDVQGNESIVKALGDITTSVFITPPTLSSLKDRLYGRATDKDEVIQKRLEMAKTEIKRVDEYDFLIINDDFDKAAKELKLVAKCARLKLGRGEIAKFVQSWEDI